MNENQMQYMVKTSGRDKFYTHHTYNPHTGESVCGSVAREFDDWQLFDLIDARKLTHNYLCANCASWERFYVRKLFFPFVLLLLENRAAGNSHEIAACDADAVQLEMEL